MSELYCRECSQSEKGEERGFKKGNSPFLEADALEYRVKVKRTFFFFFFLKKRG
jgi:hypothetical protein